MATNARKTLRVFRSSRRDQKYPNNRAKAPTVRQFDARSEAVIGRSPCRAPGFQLKSVRTPGHYRRLLARSPREAALASLIFLLTMRSVCRIDTERRRRKFTKPPQRAKARARQDAGNCAPFGEFLPFGLAGEAKCPLRRRSARPSWSDRPPRRSCAISAAASPSNSRGCCRPTRSTRIRDYKRRLARRSKRRESPHGAPR